MLQKEYTPRVIILVLTALAAHVSLHVPGEIFASGSNFLAAIFILAGIPHGAADHLIFQRVNKNMDQKGSKLRFYLFYLLVIAAYGMVWWLFPPAAFILFLLISIYHFGQSNWHRIEFRESITRLFAYMIWGGYVIFLPVMLYHNEASHIIHSITGVSFSWLFKLRFEIIFILIALNFVNLNILMDKGYIDFKGFKKELINLLVLGFLFFTTPLVFGFAIYFILWHSTSAVQDQIDFLRNYDKRYNIRTYLKDVVPLSVMSFIGLIVVYYWQIGIEGKALNWGLLFLFISLLTVPHALIMDRLLGSSHHMNLTEED